MQERDQPLIQLPSIVIIHINEGAVNICSKATAALPETLSLAGRLLFQLGYSYAIFTLAVYAQAVGFDSAVPLEVLADGGP